MGGFVIACCEMELGWLVVSSSAFLMVPLTKREFLRHDITSDGRDVATWG
jgi:hypothetical protein